MKQQFSFTTKLWKYKSTNAAWYFVSLPKGISQTIKQEHGKNAAAWGSLKVQVKIGKTQWTTSVFRDSKKACYILPVKALVRRSEKLEANQDTKVKLRILIVEDLFAE